MKQEKREEIFRKLNEEYHLRRVILKSGHTGDIVSVTSANGFEMPLNFDIQIEGTIYDISVCNIVGIQKSKS